MNRTDVASLAFRLLGIWFLVPTIQFASRLAIWVFTDEDQFGSSATFVLSGGVGLLIHFAGACFLIAKAKPLANRWFPPREGGGGEGANRPAAFLAASLAFLGIWLVVDASPNLVATLAGTNSEEWSGAFWIDQPVVHPLIRLIAGLVLVFGCHAIARWWEKTGAVKAGGGA